MAGWQDHPFTVKIQAGETKAFCMCGLTQTPPFCNGSHKATDITPHVETVHEPETLYICGCRQSRNKPFCDGTHKTL